MDDEKYKEFLAMRGVHNPCTACKGLGVRWYSNSTSWRGRGVGTRAMCQDVCNSCWGTGDQDRTGLNLLDLVDAREEDIQAKAAEHLAHNMGTSLLILKPTLLELADELDKMAGKTRGKSFWFNRTAENLARILRSYGT